MAEDDYKQALGRSKRQHGPFVDETGTPMMEGDGTVLRMGNSAWNPPGGGSAYVDEENGDSLLIFHAQDVSQNGVPHFWLKKLQLDKDWPVIADLEGTGTAPR